MMQTRYTVLGAVVCALSLLSGERAHATYNYSTTLTITGVSSGGTFANSATGATATFGGTTVTLSNVARTGFFVPGSNTVNIGDVAIATTTAPPGTDFTISYSDVISLTNVAPPGTNATGTVTLTGTMTFAGISTGTGVTSNTYTITSGSANVGGISFVVNGSNFGNPTINGSPGNLGGSITATAPNPIPEPASVTMLGLGVGALGIIRFRRRFRSA